MLEWRDLGYQYMAYPTNHNPINKEIFDSLGSILQKNGGMELLNIKISEVKQEKKEKRKARSVFIAYSDDILLTEAQRQELQKVMQDFIPLAINPIFTALRNLRSADPALTLLFLREVQEQIQAIEESAKKPSLSASPDSSPAPILASSAIFHSIPEGLLNKDKNPLQQTYS